MSLKGLPQAMARLESLKPDRGMMEMIGLAAIREQKLAAEPFRKTGTLEHSIGLGTITDRSVDTVAGANYAGYVERGTGIYGPHNTPIVPVRAKMLRWESGGSRATGRGSGSTVHFAKKVRGRRATPFMLPGAEKALASLGLKDILIKRWNDAA